MRYSHACAKATRGALADPCVSTPCRGTAAPLRSSAARPTSSGSLASIYPRMQEMQRGYSPSATSGFTFWSTRKTEHGHWFEKKSLKKLQPITRFLADSLSICIPLNMDPVLFESFTKFHCQNYPEVCRRIIFLFISELIRYSPILSQYSCGPCNLVLTFQFLPTPFNLRDVENIAEKGSRFLDNCQARKFLIQQPTPTARRRVLRSDERKRNTTLRVTELHQGLTAPNKNRRSWPLRCLKYDLKDQRL